MDEREEYNRILDGLRDNLDVLIASGVTYIAAPKGASRSAVSQEQAPLNGPGLKERIISCAECPRSVSAVRSALGEGPTEASLVFIGGASGGTEAARDLLTKMIEAMGFKRSDVYVLDSVRCSSSAGASDEEVAACRGFAEEELGAMTPKVIVTLGPVASFSLLGSRDVAGIRGRFHEWRGLKVMPTYGTEELMSDPSLKKDAWEDLRKVMDALGRKGPSR
jgi:uracil-DNA glycosylase